jgi:hypothetical protein
MTRTRMFLATLAATGAALALAATGAAQAHDTDGNGYLDFVIREQPYLPNVNVGARCELSYVQGGGTLAKLTVRPPRVWSLWGLQNQSVAWRATFVNVRTGAVVAQGSWVPGTASANASTDFGGWSAPGVMITWAQYWHASQYHTYYPSLGYVKASVEVAWYHPWSGGWVYRLLPVQWYLSPSNLVASADRITGC